MKNFIKNYKIAIAIIIFFTLFFLLQFGFIYYSQHEFASRIQTISLIPILPFFLIGAFFTNIAYSVFPNISLIHPDYLILILGYPPMIIIVLITNKIVLKIFKKK